MSRIPCLFHLSNPIVVKLKLHKQEDIELFNKLNYVVKKPKWVFQCRHFVETLNLFVRPKMWEFQRLLFIFHVGHNNITTSVVSILSQSSLLEVLFEFSIEMMICVLAKECKSVKIFNICNMGVCLRKSIGVKEENRTLIYIHL